MDVVIIITSAVIGAIIGIIAGASYTVIKILLSEYKAKKQWKEKKGVFEVKENGEGNEN